VTYIPDDLQDLPREERDLRMRIRREIQGKIEAATETEPERRFRERVEQAQARRAEPESKARDQSAWNEAFDRRFDDRLFRHVNEDGLVAEAAGFALAQARKEARELVVEAVAKAVEELRKEMESRLAASERRAGASEARAQKLGAELTELQERARDSTIRMTDDLRQRDADIVKVDKAVADLRIETGDKLSVLRERVADAVENRPVLDQDQVDRVVEAAVARTRVEMRAELGVEFARSLEAQRRESAIEFQTLKERLGDIAGRPNFDQSQIERAAATVAESAVAQLRVGLDDVAEAQARTLDTRLVDLEARVKGAADKLPVAQAWTEGSIIYEAEVVTHNGATFQAVRNTAKTPGVGEDWRCLALAGVDGRDGVDGRSLRVRGVFDLRDSYNAMDVVAYEGQGYVAKCDNPGVPGVDDGWLLIAARGVKGERGEPGKVGQRGHKGDTGPSGAVIDEWRIAREHFCVVPFYSDGTAGPPLRLRDLFQEFLNQTG